MDDLEYQVMTARKRRQAEITAATLAYDRAVAPLEIARSTAVAKAWRDWQTFMAEVEAAR